MTTSDNHRSDDLQRLEKQCGRPESQCAEYVRRLKAANQDLNAEIAKRKEAEAAIRLAHAELETTVAERTSQIRELKDRLQAENVILRQELADTQRYGTIIGDSPAVTSVVAQIELVAPTDANVLIHGQSGTGKELVAREIHRRSRRQAGPLIKVNCATIPKDLYESEFFGNEPSLNHDADENTQSGNQHSVLSLRPDPRRA
jgi:transcriptional regulator with GAF, ATPase, and Fis domain